MNTQAEIEAKWQAAWLKTRAFEPAPDDKLANASADEKNKFFFTVPYPYVSGNLHVGHGRTYANGDVIARFHRMRGRKTLWPMAFHITGTPVLAVSAKIAAGDAETLKMYEEYVSCYENDAKRVKEIVASFAKPEAVVAYFSKKIVLDFQRMGFSLDYSRQFTTGDLEYNKFIEWQFGRYKQKGFLKQASYPVLYCPRDANAVGEDDIKDGDTQPVDVLKFAAFKSKLEDASNANGSGANASGGNAFLVSCTLRPETIFGITNVFVNPAAQYVKARVGVEGGKSETWFVSEAALEKLKLQGHKIEVLGKENGDYFVGKYCVTPLGVKVPILPASFVDVNNASGFVHSVPAHAPWDWQALEDLKKDKKTLAKYADRGLEKMLNEIKPVSLISVEGYGEFPAQEILARMKVANTKEHAKIEKATNELYKAEFYGGKMKKGVAGEFAGLGVVQAKDAVAAKLLKNGSAAWFYETNRHAECRCGATVVVAVLNDQWFLDFNSPGWKDDARDCLNEMTVYPPAYRKQFLDVFEWLDKRPCARRRGLGTKLPFANGWIIESLSDSTIYMAFYTVIKRIREFGLKPEQLTPEFFDFVFLGKSDAAALAKKIGCDAKALTSIRSEFLFWYPNDLRHTAVAHVTNHLSFFIFAHAACFDRPQWPRGITLNEMIIAEGTKMSKSKGNVVLLNDVARDYGADLFRVYAVGAADFGSTLDFRKRDIEATRRSLARFVDLTGKLVDAAGDSNEKTDLVKVTLSRFESTVRDATLALDEFRLRDYVQTAFYKQINFFEEFTRRATPTELATVGKECAARWIALLSPVVPHACEELWEKAQKTGLTGSGKGFVSVSKWPEARAELIDAAAEANEDLVASVVADSRKIALLLKKQKIARLTVIVASAAKAIEAKKLVVKANTPEELASMTKNDGLKAFLQKKFYELKQKPALLEIDDYAVLRAAAPFIGKTLGCPVAVEREEESKSERAARAMPGRPAVQVE